MSSNSFTKGLKKDIKLFDKLHNRYLKYIDAYKPIYFKHLESELTALHDKFPNVDFIMHARIKSFDGYTEKFERKLKEGKTGNVYDLYAKKYIIISVDSCTVEEVLTDMCYEFEKFLLDFNSKNFADLPAKRKDYIEEPKANNYQAIHVTFQSKTHKDLFEETQIKTSRMHLCADCGEANHRVYKSRAEFNLKKVPVYFTSTDFKNKYGNYIVRELTSEECMNYYYGEKKDDATMASSYEREL